MKEQHIVEKVKVDVDVNSIELAERIKSEINDFIQNEVLSIVEAYFAELDLPEELKEKVIQLDKVDLSIETSSWNTNSIVLKQTIRDEVEKQMGPVIEDLKEQSIKDEFSISNAHDRIKDQTVSIYSKEERVLKSLFYFLDHGTLPWWVKSVEESRELFSTVSLLTALDKKADLARREFQIRRGNYRSMERLVHQFPMSIVSELIQIALSRTTVQREKVTSIIVEEIKSLSKSEMDNKVIRMLVDLSKPGDIEKVFRNDESGAVLFNHVHTHLFHSNSSVKELEETLKTTETVLHALCLFGGKENFKTKAKTELVKSLNESLPSKVLISLKKTEVYKKLSAVPGIDDETITTLNTSDKYEASNPEAEKLSVESSPTEDAKQTENITDSISEAQFDEHNDSKGQNSMAQDSEESGIRSGLEQKSKSEGSIGKSESVESEELLESSKMDKSVEEGEINNTRTSDSDEHSNQLAEPYSESRTESERDENSSFNKEEKISKSTENKEINSEIVSDEDFQKGDRKEVDHSEQIESSIPEDEVKDDREVKATKPTDHIEQTSENKKRQESNKVDALSELEKEEEEGKDRAEKEEMEEFKEILRKRIEEAPLKKKTMDKMPNQLFVANAGLVLLNPFLLALFKHLELIGEDGKLVAPELTACLLHYAATGREGDFEFEMAFEKYLCGIPPGVSLNRKIELTETHKSEVEKVLNSVLQHWTALKSNSIELLRNEFLTRSGKLIVETSNHRLVIERKTFDLLLDKLPWSYSLLKFSWTDTLIFVEW